MSCKHGGDRVIAFDRAGILFVFNLHPTQSFTDYKLGVDTPGKYKVVLDSDEEWFGGHNRVDHKTEYFTNNEDWAGRRASIMVRGIIGAVYWTKCVASHDGNTVIYHQR